ncbi:MAG: hypothetical protein QM734_17345 [Cyclobacteriaceae bacterium]
MDNTESVLGSKASTALFNSIKINGSATLVSPAVLNVRGDFTNSGAFNAGVNAISFGGTTAQSILGTTNTQFYQLIVNKSTNPVTVGTASTVTNTLTLTAGSISNASNLLTMGSGSTIIRANGTITGLVRLVHLGMSNIWGGEDHCSRDTNCRKCYDRYG